MIRSAIFAIAIGLCGAGAWAFELSFPATARQIANRTEPFGSYRLPIGPWTGEAVPHITLEGRVSRKSFRLEGDPATTLQILTPIREALLAEGFVEEFECRVRACGGFDFRFGIEVLTAPDMYVDLRDFRFFSARRGTEDGVGVLVSRSQNVAYVQIISVAPALAKDVNTAVDSDETALLHDDANELDTVLRDKGHIILDDLDFGSGDFALAGQSYGSISALAGFLREYNAARIALVGHTDAVGGADENLELSQGRAETVRGRLISEFGIDGARIEAAGVGYWSPIASNLSQEGRNRNRRVEAVLLSID